MTPLESYPELARAIGCDTLYLKREDVHPYGSHKGRSIPHMIDTALAEGKRQFAISSSGNAALAAALHVAKINSTRTDVTKSAPVELDIFVGNHVSATKLARLKDLESEQIRVFRKERPLQALNQAVQEGKVSLRQSTSDVAIEGYKSLADELLKSKDIGAVFVGTSSGTTAQALAQYFAAAKRPIQVHIVQTSSCHPIADAFQSFDGADEESIADAIVDQTAYRKDAVHEEVLAGGGAAWVATNDAIYGAMDLVAKHAHIDISTNSALSVVGAMQAVALGHDIRGAIVCLICGA